MSRLAEKILNDLENKQSTLLVKFIAIDGHGGSGKSTLAALLAKELPAGIIHQDDFASWDSPFDWWPMVIEKVFEPIKNSAKTISYERSQWWPDHKPEPVVDQPVMPIMILEGVSSSRKEFRPYLSYAIWVEAPKDVCLQRGIERDKDQGSLKKITAMWEQWYKDEEEYIARDNPRVFADTIIDGRGIL